MKYVHNLHSLEFAFTIQFSLPLYRYILCLPLFFSTEKKPIALTGMLAKKALRQSVCNLFFIVFPLFCSFLQKRCTDTGTFKLPPLPKKPLPEPSISAGNLSSYFSF